MAVFGDTLRQARAHKGVTLKEAEEKTRINRHHLLALEEEHFTDLPPLIYQRGIVRNYATYLDLDANKLLAMFLAERGVSPEEAPSMAPAQPLEMPNHWAPNFAIIAFLVVMSAVVFAWMYSVYFSPKEAAPTPTEIIPTVTPLNSDTLFFPSPTIFVPSATPTPRTKPSATPKPSPTARPTVAPSVDSNASSADANSSNAGNSAGAAGSGTSGNASQDGNSSNGSGARSTSNSTGQYSFDFVATGDIGSLQVVVDGALAFDAPLTSGDATGYFTGNVFEVRVSDPDLLEVYRDGGKPFVMGDSYFSLP